MKERPILFSSPMVRAILDGRKTQTRRVVKPQPPKPVMAEVGVSRDPGSPSGWSFICDQFDDMPLTCSHGQPGDRLWVRETHFVGAPGGTRVRYAADDMVRVEDGTFARAVSNPPKWKPSIHMPRWASRIDLEIEAVRVERLQDITDSDAIAKGIPDYPDFTGDTPVNDFSGLWESINGPGSWSANPWVWVIQFRRVKP